MQKLIMISLNSFFFFNLLYGQVVLNEDFSNFFPKDSLGAYSFWPMDNTNFPPNSFTDRSGNNKTLTANGSTAGQVQASILIQNGYSEDFNASGSFFRHDDAYWNALSTSGFSFVVAIRFESLTGSLFIYTRDDGGSNRQFGFLTNGTQARFYCYNSGGEFRRPSSSLSTNTWYLFVGIYDTTGATGSLNLYRNGTVSAEALVGTANDTLRTPTGIAFNISGIASGALDMNADVSLLALYRGALSTKRAKEIGFLAANWNSENGGVTRDLANHPWAQGIISDTIFTAIGTTGTASGHVDAWGASGGETLYIFNKSGDVQSITNLSTLSQRFNIYSITFAASDSIYFYSPGTVYIDNVYLEAGESSPNAYSNSFTGFPKFSDFINDEAIQ